MQLVQFTLTGDPRIFVESHATGSLESVNGARHESSFVQCQHAAANYLCVAYSNGAPGCLMNRRGTRFIDFFSHSRSNKTRWDAVQAASKFQWSVRIKLGLDFITDTACPLDSKAFHRLPIESKDENVSRNCLLQRLTLVRE